MSLADRGTPITQQDCVEPEDIARAETVLPVSCEVLQDVLLDVERLFRLNPMLSIRQWSPAEYGFRFVALNESNGREIDLGVVVEHAPAMLTFRYDSGLKRATHFMLAAAASGTRLVVTEHYPRIENPDDPRIADVDKSLVPWVAALRRHLLARLRWGWLPGWRWWSERFLLSMPPRQRRIVRLIVWVSIFEFLVFIGLVLVLRWSA